MGTISVPGKSSKQQYHHPLSFYHREPVGQVLQGTIVYTSIRDGTGLQHQILSMKITVLVVMKFIMR